ncbi:MAG: head-tail connector protein [Lactobacillus sp.]|jgi:hypothetical protein|nr:head-tail connector protein [Lactobacillus sp.]MCH4067962.1 head-tail connector protein [Lactobacillus sp.]MCI1303599.1 head-tail connector protein [Lactobacillus sp.]MCI1329892.1 head-tail connector protein [Lactobacillus sp.]MCI1399492.1 head-tail connector protein [Lactobacillus sp.]
MTDDKKGVTVQELREYLQNDGLSDAFLQGLIDDAENNARNSIDDSLDLDVCRKYPDFNMAVKILADFENWMRGQHTSVDMAYPRSYLYRLNQCRWKIRREQHGK